MKIILASSFNNIAKDKDGKKYAAVMPDNNLFLTNLLKNTPGFDSVVVVASDPAGFEITDFYANLLFQSLRLSGLVFKTETVFDNRNKDQANEIFANADLIFLAGGRVDVQNEFFKKVEIKKLLQNSSALIVGGSAGAMNLCETALSFPYFIKGLGFCDKLIVPHFDGVNKSYKRDNKDEYDSLMILSRDRELIGIDENSYLLVVDKDIKPFGNIFRIKNGICQRY